MSGAEPLHDRVAMTLRRLTVPAQAVLELTLGVAALTAPFALSLGVAGGAISVVAGLLLVGRALAATDARPRVAWLGAVDQALGVVVLVAALLVALTGDGPAVATLAALGTVQLLLSGATRYTSRT